MAQELTRLKTKITTKAKMILSAKLILCISDEFLAKKIFHQYKILLALKLVQFKHNQSTKPL